MEIKTPQENTPIRFNFVRLKFTPYNGVKNQNTRQILERVITFLSQEKVAGRGILIDKHEGREKDLRRPLFVTSVTTMLKDKRVRGSLALLRAGKIPRLKPTDKFLLVPLDTSLGQIAEETHFFIDYSTDSVILCVEFNSNGPRLSDIEYYFRVVARDQLHLAKATETEYYMDSSIDKTLAELKDVLNFEVKIQPQNLSQLEPALQGQYFTGINTLAQKVKPNFIKLEALFQTPGRQYTASEINKEAVSMVKQFLTAFKAKPTNIGAFENFTVTYKNSDGNDEVFNLLKGKKEIVKYGDPNNLKEREMYELIEPDLNNFVEKLR